MNAVDVIADAARSTGYREEAVRRDFVFADVLAPANPARRVALATFTRTPPSYRCAAIAAVRADHGQTETIVAAHRALGAPLLFVIHREHLSLWQVRGDTPRLLQEHLTLDQVPDLFEANRRDWHPDAIHRAKSIGAIDQSYQLDFVDVGLLPAVEGQIHAKLDRLLHDMLEAAQHTHFGHALEPSLFFPVIFRLLAAKVLYDRQHTHTLSWNTDNLSHILDNIESYYSLAPIPALRQADVAALAAAWSHLRSGITFSNVSSDDLAFVYENTLVTRETRKQFGTHSTPRQLAEYAVSRLDLHRLSLEKLRIYEPFAGAGVFLVSALRHVRDLLPADWNDAQRHDFLVERLSGDEIDMFACEVAALSLILADYPNRNGWRISETDLFLEGQLESRLGASNVVLCNPPFENFTDEERLRYGLSHTQYSKPIKVLQAALDARPRALAFVLQRGFILQGKFRRQRQQLEQQYRDLELVELPDRIFRASGFETSLVVAKDPRPKDSRRVTLLRSTVVSDHDRSAFLKTGHITSTVSAKRPFSDSVRGHLWISVLGSVWGHLEQAPRLGDYFAVHRGIEWQGGQGRAWANESRPGYRLGFHTAQHTSQFVRPKPVWLDCRQHRLRGNAYRRLQWGTPKLVANAARLSRGPWRIGASLDTEGMICSQQYFSLWQQDSDDSASLKAFAAVLNGPLANAFLAIHSPEERMRIGVLKRIPVPAVLPDTLPSLVDEYIELLCDESLSVNREGRLSTLIFAIDATVLSAYDLPARLERELLAYFPAEGRPVAHHWLHWNGPDAIPGLTLAERLSTRYDHGTSISDVFAPLPSEEAAALRTYWP